MVCAGCTHASPSAVQPDAASSFTFTADYVLDSTITSALVGSASYIGGQAIHVDLDFESYAASQGSGLAVLVTAGTDTGVFAIKPSCPSGCTNASAEMLDADVSWQNGVIVTDESGSCDSPGNSCGWAE